MSSIIDKLINKAKENKENKDHFSELFDSNSEDAKIINQILEVNFSDEEVIDSFHSLNEANQNESSYINENLDSIEQDKNDIFSEAQEHHDSLQENISLYEQADQITDIASTQDAIDSTQERLDALNEVALLLDEEFENNSDSKATSLNENSKETVEKKNEFKESLKAEPSLENVFTNDAVYNQINNASLSGLEDIILKENLAQSVDFGRLDVETARGLTKAIYLAKKDFPDLQLQMVGSSQSFYHDLEESVKADVTRNYVSQKGSNNLDMGDLYSIDQEVHNQLKDLDFKDHMATFYEIGDKQNKFYSICINEDVGKDHNIFVSEAKSLADSGEGPIGVDSVKGIVDHEIAHYISTRIKAADDTVMKNLFSKFSQLDQNGKKLQLSTHAGTDIEEFIAEGWSEYKNNIKCRPLAKEIGMRLKRLYNPNVQKKGQRELI